MTSTAHIKPSSPALLSVPLNSLHEWANNPRKTHDAAKHAALVESIKSSGGRPLQAPLVRPIGSGNYEVVCGNRRLRALVAIHGATSSFTVPVVAQELDDVEALAAAEKENGDRDGLLPLEEAELFRQLTQEHGLTVPEAAARTGKTPELVSQRLRLLELAPFGRQVLAAGWLSLGSALALAQLRDQADQLEVLSDLGFRPREGAAGDDGDDGDGDDGYDLDDDSRGVKLPTWVAHEGVRVPSLRDVQQAISQRRRQLVNARFPILADDLIPEAGPCSACPKRSGAQPALFGVGSRDNCLDATCWQRKSAAHAEQAVAAAKARGALIDDKTAKKLFNTYKGFNGHDLLWSADFVDAATRVAPYNVNTPLWRDLIDAAGRAADVVVAVDPAGVAHELLPKAIADKLRPAQARADDDGDGDDGDGDPEAQARAAKRLEAEKEWKKKEAEQAKLRKAREALVERAFDEIGAALGGFDDAPWARLLVRAMFAASFIYGDVDPGFAKAVGVSLKAVKADADDEALISQTMDAVDTLDDRAFSGSQAVLACVRKLVTPHYGLADEDVVDAFLRATLGDLGLSSLEDLAAPAKKAKAKATTTTTTAPPPSTKAKATTTTAPPPSTKAKAKATTTTTTAPPPSTKAKATKAKATR